MKASGVTDSKAPHDLQLYIHGQWQRPQTGQLQEVGNPVALGWVYALQSDTGLGRGNFKSTSLLDGLHGGTTCWPANQLWVSCINGN